jgi:hypothetical protein
MKKMGKIEARERGWASSIQPRERHVTGRHERSRLRREKEETRQNCRSTVTLIGGALDMVSSRSDSNGNFPFVRAEAGGGRCPTAVLVLWVGPAVRTLLYAVGWRLVVSLSTIFSAMSLHCTRRLVEHLAKEECDEGRCRRTLSAASWMAVTSAERALIVMAVSWSHFCQ